MRIDVGLTGAAFYTSHFASSNNKIWGSLAAVIVMLTWLWLSSLALLFGATERREGDPQPPPRRSNAIASTPTAAQA